MKKYLLVKTNGERTTYEMIKTNRTLAEAIAESNAWNKYWSVMEDQSFEVTAEMEHHMKLVKEYREEEEKFNKMADTFFDQAQWYYSYEVLSLMEKELDQQRDVMKEKKKAMIDNHEVIQHFTHVEKRGLRKLLEQK